MAKGSAREKIKICYCRFYVDGGNLVQKEFAGTVNKSETEKMLRRAFRALYDET